MKKRYGGRWRRENYVSRHILIVTIVLALVFLVNLFVVGSNFNLLNSPGFLSKETRLASQVENCVIDFEDQSSWPDVGEEVFPISLALPFYSSIVYEDLVYSSSDLHTINCYDSNGRVVFSVNSFDDQTVEDTSNRVLARLGYDVSLSPRENEGDGDVCITLDDLVVCFPPLPDDYNPDTDIDNIRPYILKPNGDRDYFRIKCVDRNSAGECTEWVIKRDAFLLDIFQKVRLIYNPDTGTFIIISPTGEFEITNFNWLFPDPNGGDDGLMEVCVDKDGNYFNCYYGPLSPDDWDYFKRLFPYFNPLSCGEPDETEIEIPFDINGNCPPGYDSNPSGRSCIWYGPNVCEFSGIQKIA